MPDSRRFRGSLALAASLLLPVAVLAPSVARATPLPTSGLLSSDHGNGNNGNGNGNGNNGNGNGNGNNGNGNGNNGNGNGNNGNGNGNEGSSSPAPTPTSNPDPGDDPSNNTKGDLNLVTGSLPSFQAGQEGWVSLIWTAGTDVCDVEVTVKAKDVEVTYPTNTGSFSSLYINNALAETNSDYTALKLTAPSGTGSYPVEFEATYTRLKDSATLKKSDNLVYQDVTACSGNSGKVKRTINLPVAASNGPAVSLQTPSLQLKSGAPSWVALAFKGNAPGLENFRVTVTPPDGFEVVYPSDGSSSGLSQNTGLPVGVTDSSGIRIDPLESKPGTYRLPVQATWTGGSFAGTVTVQVVS